MIRADFASTRGSCNREPHQSRRDQAIENAHSGALTVTVPELLHTIARHVNSTLGKNWEGLSQRELFLVVALAVRDCMVQGMLRTQARYQHADANCLY